MEVGYKVQIQYVPKLAVACRNRKRKMLNDTFSHLTCLVDLNSVELDSQTVFAIVPSVLEAFNNNPDIIISRVLGQKLL